MFLTSIETYKSKFIHFLFLSTIMCFSFSSCQKENTAEFERQAPKQQEALKAAQQELRSRIEQGKIISKLDLAKERIATAPTNARDRSNAADLFEHLAHNHSYQYYDNLVMSIINPEDYICEPTAFEEILQESTKDFTKDDALFFARFRTIPTLDAQLDDDTDEDFFGYTGQFTSTILKTFVRLKTFWDIPTDIQLSDMHGSVFKNAPRVAQILKIAFMDIDDKGNPIPYTDEKALELANLLKTVFGSPAFNNYNHPLLSFNAFAISIPQLGLKKIVMGDGIMEVYAQLEHRTIAEKQILAHEYGHHIQFAKNYFSSEHTPEASRRVELMADTYAAYFLAHGKGAFVHSQIVKRSFKAAALTGDCHFNTPSHHGTPNQRGKAADLGTKLAKRTSLRDKIYTSQQIFDFFEAALPDMIAPDAE
jgi:hypothetical protein